MKIETIMLMVTAPGKKTAQKTLWFASYRRIAGVLGSIQAVPRK
jgi:hypothetical protein